jgi:hypothetical protein
MGSSTPGHAQPGGVVLFLKVEVSHDAKLGFDFGQHGPIRIYCTHLCNGLSLAQPLQIHTEKQIVGFLALLHRFTSYEFKQLLSHV